MERTRLFPAHLPAANIGMAGLSRKISRLDTLFAVQHHCFGMDQKIQFSLEAAGLRGLSRKVFQKVPQEPVTLGYWSLLIGSDFSNDRDCSFVSALCGKAITRRTNRMFSHDEAGNTTYFEDKPPEIWQGEVSLIRSGKYDALVEAILCYTRIIFLHPFIDGNGRLARAMIYGSLARHGLLRSPCLGIGATFDLQKKELAYAMDELSAGCAWHIFLSRMAAIVDASIDVAEKVRRDELGNYVDSGKTPLLSRHFPTSRRR